MVLQNGKILGMPNYNNYLRNRETYNKATARAILAYNRIIEKPTTITIDGQVGTQIVRIEFNRYILDEGSQFTETQNLRGVMFGVIGHPSAPNNSFQSDDTFFYNGEKYRVESVWQTLGEIQAIIIKMN